MSWIDSLLLLKAGCSLLPVHLQDKLQSREARAKSFHPLVSCPYRFRHQKNEIEKLKTQSIEKKREFLYSVLKEIQIIYDQKKGTVTTNKWNLTTGVRAKIIILKEDGVLEEKK